MQRLFLSLVAVMLFAVTVSAQQNTPTIKFETLEIDYGTIERGSDGVRNFAFTNIGIWLSSLVTQKFTSLSSWNKRPV